MPRLGVLGWPVAHSRSPAMHNAALAELGLGDWRYQRLPVPPELFAQTVSALGPAGFRGANVTIPHKVAALELARPASQAARAIGAANTLTFAADGGIEAENTDAPGLIAALDCPLEGLRVLVLGAGGSARAAAWALREAGAAEVSVWNRTSERARVLAEELGVRHAEHVGGGRSAHQLHRGRPAPDGRGAFGVGELGLDEERMSDYAYVADLVYGDRPTELLRAAARHGARTLDGLEVLVAQGALSFERWTARAAPVEVMRRAARGAPPGP